MGRRVPGRSSAKRLGRPPAWITVGSTPNRRNRNRPVVGKKEILQTRVVNG
jgi:hypothetical protein